MSYGQGNIKFTNNTAAGPPFPATAADNGLSVDPVSGHIVLGNDFGSNTADLLSDRYIGLVNFFGIHLEGPDDAIDLTDGRIFMHDIATFFQSIDLLVTPSQSELSINGDSSVSGIPPALRLTDQTQPSRNYQIRNHNGFFEIVANASSHDKYFFIDYWASQIARFGDIDGTGAGTMLELSFFTFDIFANIPGMLEMSLNTGIFELGNIGAGNTSKFHLVDGSALFNFSSNGHRLLETDGGNSRYRIGDIDGAFGGGLNLDINDATGHTTVNDTSNTILDIILTGIGIGRTASANTAITMPLANLPAFANNAAAVLGGLVAGDFYRISVAGTSTVAIVE